MDNYLKRQLKATFLGGLTYTILVPLMTKLHGVYWTTSMISVFMLLTRVSVAVAPLFRHWSLWQCYWLWLGCDILYMGVSYLYFIDIPMFLYVDTLLMFIVMIVGTVYLVNFNTFCLHRYGETIYKDYSYMKGIVASVSGGISFGAVIGLEAIKFPTEYYFYLYWFGLLCCFYIQGSVLYLHGDILKEEHNRTKNM